ncbi:MAG: 3-oxoacyl-[acyl-carrier-protein] reductase [Candidatus Neomarinimicrobiota bacterium]|nr:3-oxoacyl-[acyl-carrier-protein] reductase [Candidatus Neomarinimicrobiota bacterium]|tara:strand:- start:4739 stop:5485 length:747 start_codon:yes stop_codon:yes gene_type:complete
MFKLGNKVSIVTGASKGIGKAIAKIFAQAGTHVVCVSRTKDDLNILKKEILNDGGSVSIYSCDVSNFDEVEGLIRNTVEEFSKIDIIVNNAGITRDGLIMRMSDEDWNTVIDINLKGTFNAIKAVSRQMMKQRSGRIINISSVVGLKGNAGQANYAASKAGIIGLTKSSSKELASRGITVNCIAPGYIATDMTDQLTDKVKEEIINRIPLGYIGKTDNIAAAALFLASDEAEYITGQTISVDGGMVIN